MVQAAWLRGQVLNLYGWVYGLEDGRVKELKVSVLEISDVDPTYRYDAQCEEPS